MDEYGVPQKRVRFILIGSLKSDVSGIFDKIEKNCDEFLKSKGLTRKTTVQDAIGDLYKSNGCYECPDCNQKFESGKYGKSFSAYQTAMRAGNTSVHPNSHRFAKHTDEIVKMQQYLIDNITPGVRITPSDNLVDGLKRRGVTLLDKNSQSPTITSHPDDMVHYSEPRILTVREMARLQSFPDWYEFKGKYTTGGKLRKIDVPRYTQVGNAVPPLFAEQLGRTLMEVFHEV